MWQDDVNKKPVALEMFPDKMEGYFFYPFVTPSRGGYKKRECVSTFSFLQILI